MNIRYPIYEGVYRILTVLQADPFCQKGNDGKNGAGNVCDPTERWGYVYRHGVSY